MARMTAQDLTITKRLADGLGFAEHPIGSGSFGQARCRLVAESLWQSFTRGEVNAITAPRKFLHERVLAMRAMPRRVPPAAGRCPARLARTSLAPAVAHALDDKRARAASGELRLSSPLAALAGSAS